MTKINKTKTNRTITSSSLFMHVSIDSSSYIRRGEGWSRGKGA